ncbi:MAG: FAD-dependent oxidoreductase, partial [Candidatus Obscuribacterales bacterium]|nr:FAD-dependent oxidoreductase [Candidatus Obscuribacterales bacterium]
MKKLVALCLLCLHATAAFGQGDNDGMKTLESASRDKVKQSTSFELVDVEKLDADRYADSVKRIDLNARPKVLKCDLLIVGGGMGAVAAAMSACSAGLKVYICEATSWLGGQLSSQGVSALDENYLVESSGATKTYKAFRNSIRDYYKSLGAEDGGARFEPHLDPGNCWVSRLAFEPKVAVKLLSDLLQPYITSGHLRVFLRNVPFSVRKSTDKIRAVQFADLDSGKLLELRCKFCIDASELGDILPLAGMRYRSGAESKAETGELHAPENANPDNVQDFTYPFVVEFCPGESHVIEKPKFYDDFNKLGKFSLLGYRMFENSKTINEHGRESEYLPFWEYRRLIDKNNFAASVFPRDLAMINWESNDLRGENIIDQAPLTMAQRLSRGKYLSLGFLYWMQTEMPRDEGGAGYAELKLRPDLLGTTDG